MPARKAGGYKKGGVLYAGPTMPKSVKLQRKAVTTIAKAVVKNDKEVKRVINTGIFDAVNIPGCGIDGGSNGLVAAIIPLCTQGTGESNREGNVVNVKKFNLRYSLNALTTNVSGINAFPGLPFYVKVVVYRHKYNIGDSSPANLIDVNNGSAALTGNVDNLFRDLNTDEYYIAHNAKYLMCAPRHQSATVLEAASTPADAKSMLIKNIKIKLPAKLTYNDTLSTPTNAGWYMAVGCVNVDSSNISTTSFRCTVNAESYLDFTD